MLENRYVLENPANREWLQDSLVQAKRGQVVQHKLLKVSQPDDE